MTKQEKTIKRFLSKPRDFTYAEMRKMLKGFGYHEIRTGKTSGSRVAFFNESLNHIIRLHTPHPKNVFKRYQLDYIAEELKNRKILK